MLLQDADQATRDDAEALPIKPTTVDASGAPPPDASRVELERVSVVEVELAQVKASAAETEAELQVLLRDLDELRRDAREQGHDAGYKDGFAAGKQELADRLDGLDELLKGIGEQYEADIANLEASAVEVVFAATTKILGDELVKAEAVVAAVRQVIKQVVHRNKLIVHVSPPDKRRLEEAQLITRHGILDGSVEVVADERVTLGGCILETGSGSLDARIEVQLQKMRDCLLRVASQRIPEEGVNG